MRQDIRAAIFAFSQQQAPWCSDLIRLAVAQELISEGDLHNILRMLKSHCGMTVDDALEPFPLPQGQASFEVAPTEETILTSMCNVQNVNRLVDNQELSFASKGITVFYGDNGSGKSGYCRILKQVFRARRIQAEPILGNVFASGKQPSASALIKYKVGTESQEFYWKDGLGSPSAFARTTVFDANAAPVYADHQNRIDFLPGGLDILPRVGAALQAISKMIDKDISDSEAVLSYPVVTLHSGTSAGMLVNQLVSKSSPSCPTKQHLESIGEWTVADESKLAELQKGFAELSDPKPAAARLRRIRAAVINVSTSLRSAALNLSDEHFAALMELQEKRTEARTTATYAASEEFKNDPFGARVGNAAWRNLFKHAKEFSLTVYPEESFPAIGEDRYCVLCQQPLSNLASERLSRFHSFVCKATSREAEGLDAEFKLQLDRAQSAQVASTEALEQQLSEFGSISAETANAAEVAIRYADALRVRQYKIIHCCSTGTIDELETRPDAEIAPLEEFGAAFEASATELDGSSQVDGKRTQLRTDITELEDKKQFTKEMSRILDRLTQLQHVKSLKACKAACDTSAVSRQISLLRDKHLTGNFETRLRDEIRLIGLDYLPLAIDAKSERGATFIGVVLDKAGRERTSHVLSEGEFRGLALATFMAEITGIENHGGIILDDPVSSLDHRHIRQVARRLAQEGKVRTQIVLFTHSLPFYYELMEAAQEKQVPIMTHWIQRQGKAKCGIVSVDDSPWQVKRVKERVQVLRSILTTFPGKDNVSDSKYLEAIDGFYSSLRETWERLVEERLLNGVVGRFEPGVKTQSLKGVLVEDADYQKIFTAMSKASRYSGHDAAVRLQTSVPTVEEMQEDLQLLVEYEKSLKKRSEQLESRRKPLEEAPKVMSG